MTYLPYDHHRWIRGHLSGNNRRPNGCDSRHWRHCDLAGPDGTVGTGGDDVPLVNFGAVVANKGAFGTLSSAIAAASAGDTIHLAPGTYVENITIPAGKDGLVILGAKFGTSGTGRTVSGPGESTINGGIVVLSNNVVIDGVRVLDGAQVAPAFEFAGVHVQASGVEIKNSVFYRSGTVDGDSYRGVVNSVGNGNGLNVHHNLFEGWATGVYVQGANNVTVSNNTLQNNYVGMSADSYTGGNSNLDVTNNSFVNNVLEGMGIAKLVPLGTRFLR